MADSTSTEELQKPIPREFRISHPLPAMSPNTMLPQEEFPTEPFAKFQRLARDILPKFELDQNILTSEALECIKEAFESESLNPLFDELMVRQYLVACQHQFHKLMASPSLTKLSLLHHELFQASELLHSRQIRIELSDLCFMMMADVVDVYHSHFSDIIEQKFWSKTKTVDDLIKQFLKKEFERLRMLNPTTYKALTTVGLRKAIDSAPNSSVNKLLTWATNNNIVME